MNTFANRIELLRKERGLTQTDLGEIFLITKSAISSWQRRGRQPNQEVLIGLAEYFNVSLDYLLGRSDIRSPLTDNNNTKDNEEEVHSFTLKLVDELLKNNLITDPNNIPQEIVDMVIASLKADLAKKKDTK